MKVLVIDNELLGQGMDITLRAQEAGHEMFYWQNERICGEGMVDCVSNWESLMETAELIICTGNTHYPKGFEEYYAKGYPIFGPNPAAAELEHDRGKGQDVLEKAGIDILPYQVVSSPDEAIKILLESGKPYVMKPWGGEDDKSLTCVPKDLNEALFYLDRCKRNGGFNGQLMMQEMVKGVEIGIAGYFGPGGWNEAVEESFEHKKFLTGNLGQNTGEMGTVIRHVKKGECKLFQEILEPLTDHLHLLHYVGDCSVNCIVADGRPRPLEFTMRLGWPDACIRYEVFEGDPVEWMADLIYGRDSLRVRPDIALGVVMPHGDFPWCEDDCKDWAGFPIDGITEENYPHLHFQQVKDGRAPRAMGGKMKMVPMTMTAGQYPLIVTGSGSSVRKAKKKAYEVADAIRWPSNVMYRVDIGDRLKEDLPELQKHGYTKDFEF